MAPWLEEYMTALEARDVVEKANHEVYSAYASLADRAASLTASKPTTDEASPVVPPPIRPSGIRSPPPPSVPSTSALAADLQIAQSARSALQSELATTQASHATNVAQLEALRSTHAKLSSQHTSLQTRFRDRESELRGKAKLLENLQDELATTEMELTVQSREMQKLRDENQALVDRWMKRIEGEAEEMNIALEGSKGESRRPKSTKDGSDNRR